MQARGEYFNIAPLWAFFNPPLARLQQSLRVLRIRLHLDAAFQAPRIDDASDNNKIGRRASNHAQLP
jgi:hypothetical protein